MPSTETMIIEFDVSKLKIQMETRKWCTLPYPGHANGCPNYNKRDTCPPNAPVLWKYFNLAKPVAFVIVKFNLGEHIIRMYKKHPHWSYRQAKCCLYWQGKVRKILREDTKAFMKNRYYNQFTDCPEAMGVNVLRTCNVLGVPIKRNPVDFVYKVCMIGYKQDYEVCQTLLRLSE